MRDVVFEWYVPYFPDKRKMLIKAVMISAALVFFIDAVFFAAGMLIPSVILAVAGFFLIKDHPQGETKRRISHDAAGHGGLCKGPGRPDGREQDKGFYVRPSECPGVYHKSQGRVRLH